MLPETTVADAIAFAEKTRVNVADYPFQTASATLRVSSSFGVAGYDAVDHEDISVDSLIAYADLCLYRSKETGRNRVTGKALDIGGRTIILDRSSG